MKQKEKFDHGSLSMKQTKVHGWRLPNKLDEEFDFGRLSTKRTTDHNGCLSKTREKRYDYGWLLMGQTTDQNEGLSKNPEEWYELAWLSMKQSSDHNGFMFINWNKRYKFWWLSMKPLTERGRWRSMKQLNEIISEVHRWHKRLSMMEVYPKNQREKRSWMIISETNHWLGRQYTQKTKWSLYSWLVNNEQTTDQDGCKSMDPDDLYDQR